MRWGPQKHVGLLVGLGTMLSTLGCGPNHVAPFTPREREYKQGDYAQRDPSARPATGSLFSDANGGYLEDTRAVRVGDIVLVRIDESADAQGNASTDLNRDSTASLSVDKFMGLVPAIKDANPDITPEELIEFASRSGFIGEGNTSRNGKLTGVLAVRVANEMPNGDLFLEGTKVILINNEEYHLYVSGLVRPADIGQDNSVDSTRIADAQVEFTGRGDIADQQRKGWLVRALDTLNPF